MKNYTGYTRINPSFADKGDIVVTEHSKYVLSDRPTNNGNVLGKNLFSRLHWINVIVDKDIIGIYRNNNKAIATYELERR
jgi:hypothetical protein